MAYIWGCVQARVWLNWITTGWYPRASRTITRAKKCANEANAFNALAFEYLEYMVPTLSCDWLWLKSTNVYTLALNARTAFASCIMLCPQVVHCHQFEKIRVVAVAMSKMEICSAAAGHALGQFAAACILLGQSISQHLYGLPVICTHQPTAIRILEVPYKLT